MVLKHPLSPSPYAKMHFQFFFSHKKFIMLTFLPIKPIMENSIYFLYFLKPSLTLWFWGLKTRKQEKKPKTWLESFSLSAPAQVWSAAEKVWLHFANNQHLVNSVEINTKTLLMFSNFIFHVLPSNSTMFLALKFNSLNPDT